MDSREYMYCMYLQEKVGYYSWNQECNFYLKHLSEPNYFRTTKLVIL